MNKTIKKFIAWVIAIPFLLALSPAILVIFALYGLVNVVYWVGDTIAS